MNSRVISLLCIVSKLYDRLLIINRISDGTKCVIRAEQRGLRRGKECIDQVLRVRGCIDHANRRGRGCIDQV